MKFTSPTALTQMSPQIPKSIASAHTYLMKARFLLWISFLALVVGLALYFASNLLGRVLGFVAVSTQLLSLGCMAIAGNKIGQFGLKYPAASLAGAAFLYSIGFSFVGIFAPIATFFWLKSEIGKSYQSEVAAINSPEVSGFTNEA